MSTIQKKLPVLRLSPEEQVSFFHEKFLQYQARVEEILKKIIQAEFSQKSFDKELKLRNMEVYRRLEQIRSKSDIGPADINYIAMEVIPKEPAASYIDQHKTLCAVVQAYQFVNGCLDKLGVVCKSK